MNELPLLNTQRLTWGEICALYPRQHVVLVETYWTDKWHSGVRSAIVAGHGGSEDEANQRAWPYWALFLRRYPEIVNTMAIPDERGEVVVCESED
jgi:hypothetical protein